jgi:hypothetical protein
MRRATAKDWSELLEAACADRLDQHPKRIAVMFLILREYLRATAIAPQIDLASWCCAAVAAELQRRRPGLRSALAVKAAIATLQPDRARDGEFRRSVDKNRQKALRGELPKGVSLEFLASREDVTAAEKELLRKSADETGTKPSAANYPKA